MRLGILPSVLLFIGVWMFETKVLIAGLAK